MWYLSIRVSGFLLLPLLISIFTLALFFIGVWTSFWWSKLPSFSIFVSLTSWNSCLSNINDARSCKNICTLVFLMLNVLMNKYSHSMINTTFQYIKSIIMIRSNNNGLLSWESSWSNYSAKQGHCACYDCHDFYPIVSVIFIWLYFNLNACHNE